MERESLILGDLVFFSTIAKGATHVGIYAGQEKFIHASYTKRKVVRSRLDSPYYRKRFVGARRIL